MYDRRPQSNTRFALLNPRRGKLLVRRLVLVALLAVVGLVASHIESPTRVQAQTNDQGLGCEDVSGLLSEAHRQQHTVKNLDRAIELFRDAVACEPTALAYLGLGGALAVDRQGYEAEAAFRAALRLDPNPVVRYRSLGMLAGVLERRGEYEAAIDYATQSIEVAGDRWEYPTAHAVRAQAAEALGRWEDALDDRNRVVDIYPHHWHGHYRVGVALVELGRYDGAIESFRRALEIRPGRREAVEALRTTLPLHDASLAFAHAPIFLQDVDADSTRADYLAAWDYDGNESTNDNWDNLFSAGNAPAGVAYYSVTETTTHWFITYMFYHPRDWEPSGGIGLDHDIPIPIIPKGFRIHENDSEGVVLSVRKDGSEFGRLETATTVFHSDFWSYSAPGAMVTHGHEDIDGELVLRERDGFQRMMITSEAQGHGLKAYPHGKYPGRETLHPGPGGELLVRVEDGVIYYPGEVGETPETGNDWDVTYELRSLQRLWDLQLDALATGQSTVYHGWGSMLGDCRSNPFQVCDENVANLPWNWDDHDDGNVCAGQYVLDPAYAIDHYFDTLGEFDMTYVRNAYLEDLRAAGFSDSNLPEGWHSKGSSCGPTIEQMFGRLP